jgi:hypothetical protein
MKISGPVYSCHQREQADSDETRRCHAPFETIHRVAPGRLTAEQAQRGLK